MTSTKNITVPAPVPTKELIFAAKTKNMTLDLVLKHKWYDLIACGKKREEYREIKPYWVKRLLPCTNVCCDGHWNIRYDRCVARCSASSGHMNYYFEGKRVGPYTHVRFRRGYSRTTMQFEIDNVSIGVGDPGIGAPENEKVFVIKFH